MKKITLLSTFFAAFFILALSCSKDIKESDIIPEEPTESTPEESSPEQGDGIYSLTLNSSGTKTAYGSASDDGSYPKIWSSKDQICVNGITSDELTEEDGAGTSTATFRFSESIEAETYQVVYPASAYNSETKKVTLPAAQTYHEGSFDPKADIILGKGNDPSNITLYNAVAYLKIKVTKGACGNFGVKGITLAASGKKLNGSFSISPEGNALTVDASASNENEQRIIVDASSSHPTLGDTPVEFLIAVAPQTLEGGFSVTLEDMKGNTQTRRKTGSTALVVGQILLQNKNLAFDEYVPITTPTGLLAFADSCSAGSSNYFVIKDNIDMSGETWKQAGTSDVKNYAFNGVLDGGNNGDDTGCKISNLNSTTGAFINFVYNGTVKNVTLDATCKISYSEDVSDSYLAMGGIVGMSRGNIKNCYNNASLNFSSENYNERVFIGGIVGRQYRTGEISGCTNKGSIVCKDNQNGTSAVFIGGIVASIDRPDEGNDASINNCTNEGSITRGKVNDASSQSVTHVGGVIGQLDTRAASGKITITGLVHKNGNISGPDQESNSNGFSIATLVGGLIGGIHGNGISAQAGEVEVNNSHVENCTVTNGHWNNETEYGSADHSGGFIALARGTAGGVTQNIIFNTDCYVDNVEVRSRRGFSGGFASWIRGVELDACSVLNSSVVASAQVFYGGGLAACAYDSVIDGCAVTLTKNNTYSLRTRGSKFYSGGIVGWARGTTLIKNSKAFVKLMYQDGGSGVEGFRGWVAGYCNGTSTIIKNCGLGGTYGKSTPTITLSSENFSDYIYGSSSTNVTSEENYYWDGTL